MATTAVATTDQDSPPGGRRSKATRWLAAALVSLPDRLMTWVLTVSVVIAFFLRLLEEMRDVFGVRMEDGDGIFLAFYGDFTQILKRQTPTRGKLSVGIDDHTTAQH